MTHSTDIPFDGNAAEAPFPGDAPRDDRHPQPAAAAPSAPASSLLADPGFLNKFMASITLVMPNGDDGDDLCVEFMRGKNPVLVRITDRRVLDHANAVANTFTHGDITAYLGSRDFGKLQDFLLSHRHVHAVRRPVAKRSIWFEDALWFNLSRPDGRCVRLTGTHWNLEQPPHPLFLSTRTERPLPEPVSSDDGEAAFQRSLPKGISEPHAKLLVGAMLGMMLPPDFGNFSFPILVITGDPGAGKSTLSAWIKELLDNANTTTVSRPTKTEDLWVTAQSHHVLVYDNLRGIWDNLSDDMCRLTTGSAIAKRTFFTNGDLFTIKAKCPIILNGIAPELTQQDLLDRAISVHLVRRPFDPDALAAADADKPLVLGWLCDLMVRALDNLATTVVHNAPRLSLVAKIATAAEPYICETPFVTLLAANQHDALVTTREHDPIIDALFELMGAQPEWRGTYKELLAALALRADEDVTRTSEWPRTANKLSAFMRANTRLIREIGIDVIPGPKHNNGRIVTVRRLAGFQYAMNLGANR